MTGKNAVTGEKDTPGRLVSWIYGGLLALVGGYVLLFLFSGGCLTGG